MTDNNPYTATSPRNSTVPTEFDEADEAATSMNISPTHPNHASIDFTSRGPSLLRRPHKPVATIVLIGETGCGKTAFMSLIINLLQGTSLFELEDVHNIHNKTGLDGSHSQTATAALYTVTTRDGFKLRILDTPGLSDTRGTDYDQEHRASINQAIKDNVPSVDAVMIVANGSVERLSAATENALTAISTLFPRSLAENVGLMFTNCDPATRNFRLQTLPQSLFRSRHWSIQNSLALVKNYRSDMESLEERGVLEARRMRIQRDFPDLITTLNRWLTWLDDCETKPTNEINDLFDQYFDIDTRINTLLPLLRDLSERRARLQDSSLKVQNAQTRLDEIDSEIQEQRSALVWGLEGGNTNTYHAVCVQENCHSNCRSLRLERILQTMRWSSLGLVGSPRASTLAARGGIGCVAAGVGAAHTALAFHRGLLVVYGAGAAGGVGVMAVAGTAYWAASKVKCDICGHPATKHELSKMSYVSKPGYVTKETEEQFQAAQTEEEIQGRKMREVQAALDETQTQMQEVQRTISDLVSRYNQIALGNDYASHIHSAIKYYEQHEERLKSNADATEELRYVRESVAVLKEKLKVLREGEGDPVPGN